jgi:hypothetical protein
MSTDRLVTVLLAALVAGMLFQFVAPSGQLFAR